MNTKALLASPLLALLLVSCSTMPERQPSSGAGESSPQHEAALWKEIPGGEAWTMAALEAIRARKHDLEVASRISHFCPGYTEATAAQQEVCWLRFFGAISRFQSNFKASAIFHQPGGDQEVGLLGLSPKACPEVREIQSTSDLTQPELNLKCGINGYASDFVESARSGREPIAAAFAGAFEEKAKTMEARVRYLTKDYAE